MAVLGIVGIPIPFVDCLEPYTVRLFLLVDAHHGLGSPGVEYEGDNDSRRALRVQAAVVNGVAARHSGRVDWLSAP